MVGSVIEDFAEEFAEQQQQQQQQQHQQQPARGVGSSSGNCVGAGVRKRLTLTVPGVLGGKRPSTATTDISEKDVYILGRLEAGQVDIPLSGKITSRKHVQLRHDDQGQTWVRDLKSLFGTWIETSDRKLRRLDPAEEYPWQPNERLHFGVGEGSSEGSEIATLASVPVAAKSTSATELRSSKAPDAYKLDFHSAQQHAGTLAGIEEAISAVRAGHGAVALAAMLYSSDEFYEQIASGQGFLEPADACRFIYTTPRILSAGFCDEMFDEYAEAYAEQQQQPTSEAPSRL
jgi:hypothetical protein